MPRGLPWLALCLSTGGCAEDAPPTAGDPAAYRQALLAEGDPQACEAIVDERTRGECLAFAARSLAAEQPEAALRICEGITVTPWSEECWFLMVDARDLLGEEARALCARSGRYRHPCSSHATAREGTVFLATWEDDGSMGADAAAEQLRLRLLPWMAPPKAEARARQLVAQHLARVERQAPLRLELCRGADEVLCAEVYAERVRFTLQSLDASVPEEFCGGELTTSAAEALGLPGWEADVHDTVQGWWRSRCAS